MTKNEKRLVLLTGLLTFFFGFGAGALLNLYLISVHSPLVEQFRSSLSFKSSIYGDGILLPIINMIIVSFLLKKREFLKRKTISLAFFFGILITSYFHISQAVRGLVNWSMPSPWNWNFLGVWHGVYMLAVASLLSLFYVVLFVSFIKQKKLPREGVWVTIGILVFLLLLRIDYSSVNISDILPWKL